MKNKIVKKLVSTLLVGAMVVSMAACGNKEAGTSEVSKVESTVTSETTKPEATPMVPEEITYPIDTDMVLSLYCFDQLYLMDEYSNWKESPFHSYLQDETGIEIDWKFPVKGADNNQAYNLLLVENELPHMIAKANMYPADAKQLADDGLIWDLTDYLPIYAPDYWELLNLPENATLKKMHTAEDGRIYSIVGLDEATTSSPYQGIMLRQDWLKECGLEIPKTTEEFENVLKTFKEKYGAVLSSTSSQLRRSSLSSLTGCNGGIEAKFYHVDGEVKFAQNEPQYKEYLTLLNKWYNEGLLDKDLLGNDNNTVRAKVLANEVGVVASAQSQLLNYSQDAEEQKTGSDWVGISVPTPDGELSTYVPDLKPNYKGVGLAAVITKTCTEEELAMALRFWNYGFTEEGSIYWWKGKEGVCWEYDANGNMVQTEFAANHPLGSSELPKRYTGAWGAGIYYGHTYEIEKTQPRLVYNARVAWRSNTTAAETTLPAIAFTAEEQQQYNDLFTAISTYVDEMAFKFITGEESLDNFDAYVETLNKMGFDTCRELTQTAATRMGIK